MKAETKQLLNEMEAKKNMSNEAKNRFYQYEEEINGVKYVFQHPGKRMIIRMTDEATEVNGKRSFEKMLDLSFKHIVVSPTVSFEYFDDPEHDAEYDRVCEICGEFAAGNFRDLGKENQE